MMGDVGTVTLTDFLLARIAEDEAVASRAVEDHYMVEGGLRWGEVGYETSPDLTIDPARVLAECEAKRRIVELHVGKPGPWNVNQWLPGPGTCRVCGGEYDPKTGGVEYDDLPCDTLRLLASVYASHKDYREEWAL